MKHLPVATGVYKRVLPFILLLPLLAALGGCSLFGIATKGNLNELADQQEQQNQQLQAQVAESEKQMDTRVTEVESKTAKIDGDLVRYETEIQSAKLELQSIKLDLDTFESDLDRASNDSKRSLQIHHSAIVSERDRLRQRLNELDELILSWGPPPQQEPVGTMTPVPNGVIIPEQESGANSAESASNETSVWKNRGNGGN